jgi:hypothetical protein
VEQFQCITQASEEFESEIQESRELLLIQANEADSTGPRTISQVRRDKLKQVALRQTSQNLDIQDEFIDVSLENIEKLIPKSAQDLADKEARRQSICLAFIWVCRWQGKIRWGMHNMTNVSFVESDSTDYSSAPSYTLIGIDFPRKVKLCNIMSNKSIHVRLLIRSITNRSILVNAEALSFSDESGGLVSSNIGIFWSEIVKHANVILAPMNSIELVFCVVVSKPGVYDLNRCV